MEIGYESGPERCRREREKAREKSDEVWVVWALKFASRCEQSCLHDFIA